MGYYGGNGARKVATVQPSATLPQTQPACLTDADDRPRSTAATGRVSASWAVPADARLGHLLRQARPRRTPAARATSSSSSATTPGTSDLLFQTSDTTWQAYNSYGGNSLYTAARPTPAAPTRSATTARSPPAASTPAGLALQRRVPDGPLARSATATTSATSPASTPTAAAALLLNHKVFLSVGHDEYWSGAQRANVEAARDAGVHLAFFSGNEVFWKTRWETSIDGSGTPYRTLVSYKETHADAKIDPLADAGPAPGATRASARPPTAAGPRTR